MMAFEGHSNHIIKLKNKSITDNYKLWCINNHGYIWSWLFHLRVNGIKTFTKGQQIQWPQQQSANESTGTDAEADFNTEKNTLFTSTHALILCLAIQLLKLKFYIYLDNLFLNIPVAQCLLMMNIYCMKTTWKKATDVSI